MLNKINKNRAIRDITLADLEHGDVTLCELDQIYKQLGFYFEVKEGKFRRIIKEKMN